MPQSFAQIYLHVVFSTKERCPFLQDAALREEAHRYLGGTCNNLGCPSLGVGGVADHVHIRCLEEHHRQITFQDEYRRLLTKYGLEWDERYVSD